MEYNNKVKSQKSKVKNIILLIVFISIFIYLFIKSVKSSIFLRNKEKVNVVFYGQSSFFYSFDRGGDTNYIIKLSSDLKSLIPGGYGFYRLGSLGKLVSLEKDPELFQKTFSVATSSIVDFYFYPKDLAVYYDNKDKNGNFPSISNILFYKSNANWIDKFFLYFLFSDRNLNHYKTIDSSNYDDTLSLGKNIQGTLYKRIYRKVGDNIQIIYQENYRAAVLIGTIIDGEGIRVVDISQNDEKHNRCLLISNKKESPI